MLFAEQHINNIYEQIIYSKETLNLKKTIKKLQILIDITR
ncbi:hypothetical protein Javan172_0002 [Streptococcus phage Javan172]|nr:hypothetical protein Javan172_0002 [Streptococcus phage Javan172]